MTDLLTKHRLTDAELSKVELQPLLFKKLTGDQLQDWLRRAVVEIRSLRKALRVLHAANAEGSKRWRSWKTDAAWESEELAEIRRAIEKEAT